MDADADIQQREPFIYRQRAQDCVRCQQLEEDPTAIGYPLRNYIFLDVPVHLVNTLKSTICKTQIKEERDLFISELKRCVSALRNSQGGAIVVHVNELDPTDRYLDFFHELVDFKLKEIIVDGRLFVQTYKKLLHCSSPNTHGFIIIIVSPSVRLVTVDFNTKAPLDNCVVDATSSEIFNILANEQHFEETPLRLRGIEHLGENRSVQVKGFVIKDPEKEAQLLSNVQELAKYIWFDLKLRHYVSSFSKVDGGGSYFLGIIEQEKQYRRYTSKIYVTKGFPLDVSKHQELTDCIKTLAREEICLHTTNKENEFGVADLMQLKLYKIIESQNYVLEVAVSAVKGLVFYEPNGPYAYMLNSEGFVKRMTFKDWLERFLRIHH